MFMSVKINKLIEDMKLEVLVEGDSNVEISVSDVSRENICCILVTFEVSQLARAVISDNEELWPS